MNATCLQLVQIRLKKAEVELTQALNWCQSYRVQLEEKIREANKIQAEVDELQAFLRAFSPGAPLVANAKEQQP